jgi:hypothetical protein
MYTTLIATIIIVLLIVFFVLRDLSLSKEYVEMKAINAMPIEMLSNSRSPSSIGYYWMLTDGDYKPMRYSRKYLEKVFNQQGTATMFGNPFGK